MAFWIRKKGEEGEGEANSASALKPTKKKDDKKDNKPKRIDNLRIPQHLRITLRSLGSPNEFVFHTKDLSATGAFVLCAVFKRYPFQQQSTLLDASVELKEPDSDEVTKLQFLAKIARVVEAQGQGASSISGFGIRIVQISQEQRATLEGFIQRNGSPDVNNVAAERAGLLSSDNVMSETALALARIEVDPDAGLGVDIDLEASDDEEDIDVLPRAG